MNISDISKTEIKTPVNGKPIIILPKGAMNDADITVLRQNGLCVVTAEDPSLVKFLEPIPDSQISGRLEWASVQVMRKILRRELFVNEGIKTVCETFVRFLAEGSCIDPNPSAQEIEKEAFNAAKMDEIRKIAREEARAERLAKKKAKESK